MNVRQVAMIIFNIIRQIQQKNVVYISSKKIALSTTQFH